MGVKAQDKELKKGVSERPLSPATWKVALCMQCGYYLAVLLLCSVWADDGNDRIHQSSSIFRLEQINEWEESRRSEVRAG